MRNRRVAVLLAVVTSLSLIATACGDDEEEPTVGPGQAGTGTQARGTLTIGAFNFTESAILSHIYAGALRNDGWTVNLRPNLGNREIVAPALERGEIDLYIGYAATELEHYNSGANEATADPRQTTERLRSRIQSKGLTALDPSSAVDQNAFGVTQATADRLRVRRLSELAPVAGQLTLGGPPECPTRPFCARGLEDRYGIRFRDFRALDAGGPLTKNALRNGDIDVGLLLSSDARGFVLLEDDRGLQNADNVVPVIRSDRVNEEARSVLNRVSAALTTEELSVLNDRANTDKEDPEVLASDWLRQNGFGR
jgi:osmoprotectant transport system substrate-binding protein